MTDSFVPPLVTYTPSTPEPGSVESYRAGFRKQWADEAEAWGSTMRVAIKTNPETAALADTLSKKMGMPLLKAQEDMGFLRAVSVMQRMKDDDIRSTNPVLYRSFQGLEFARKAWDDFEGLSASERWAKGWRSGALTAERGRLAAKLWLSGGLEWDKATGQYKQNASDRMQRREDLARLEAVQVEQQELGPITGFVGIAAKIAGQWGDAVPRALAAGAKTAAVTGGASLLAGPAAPVAVGPSMAGGFLLGASAQYTADTFAVMGGNLYADLIAANYDPDRALAASVGFGIVGTWLELAGVNIATSAVRQKIMGSVAKLAAREVAQDVPSGFVRGYFGAYGDIIAGGSMAYGRSIGGELATELPQELAQIIAEQLARRGGEDEMNPDGIASRLWNVASETVQGMALLGIPSGIAGAAGGFQNRVAAHQREEAKRAQEQRDYYKQGQSIDPKMLERDPEASADLMRQMLRQGDGPMEAHVDAETFRNILQRIDSEGAASGQLRKSTLDSLEEIVPGIKQQFADAEAVSGDVSIPTADLWARIRKTLPEFESAFSDVMRLDPQAPDADAATQESKPNPYAGREDWQEANKTSDAYAKDNSRLPLTFELVGYLGQAGDAVGRDTTTGEFRVFSVIEQDALAEKRKDRAFRDKERKDANIEWARSSFVTPEMGTEADKQIAAELKQVEKDAVAKVMEFAGTRVDQSQARATAQVYTRMVESIAREEGKMPSVVAKEYGAAFKDLLELQNNPEALSQTATDDSDVVTVYHGTAYGNFAERAKNRNALLRQAKIEIAALDAKESSLREQARTLDKEATAKADEARKAAESDPAKMRNRWLVKEAWDIAYHWESKPALALLEEARGIRKQRDAISDRFLGLMNEIPEVDKFSLARSGAATDSGWAGRGIYFALDRKEAESYSKVAGPGRLYADEKPSPYVYTAKIKRADIYDEKTAGQEIVAKVEARAKELRDQGVDYKAADVQAIREAGFKARAFQDQIGGGKEIAVFDPDAIEIVREGDQVLNQPKPVRTDTPEFKAFWRESKVVDADGKPRTLYHGTNASFEEFGEGSRRSKLDAGFLGSGFYFSSRPDVADYYAARHGGEKAQVYPVYVSLQNPFMWGPKTQGVRGLLMRGDKLPGGLTQAVLDRAGVKPMDDASVEYSSMDEQALADALREELKSRGFDGVIAETNNGSVEVVAFDSTQIKSVNNRGTWSRTDRNMLRQQKRGGFLQRALAIFLGPDSDVSTVLHEMVHWFVEVIERLDQQGSKYGRQQMDRLLAHWKLDRDQWAALTPEQRVPLLEDIAYNSEEYFASGEAPSAELRGVFTKLRSFLVGIYGAVRKFLTGAYSEELGGAQLRAISPELRSFFDRMLASDAAIEIETASRAGAARLSDAAAKAMGIEGEQLAEIRAKEAEAIEEAKAALTAEAVRGGRFFSAGRRNAEAAVRKKLEEAKKRIRAEVEASMADSPVQAAFQYLRDGLVDQNDGAREFDPSARKLDAASVRSTLGLPVVKGGKKGKSMVARIRELGGIRMDGYPGDLRGEHKIPGVFKKNGGESWERIAQQLASEGYGGEVYESDVADATDNTWLIESLKNAAQGESIYPSEFVSDSQRMQSEYEEWLKSQSPQDDADVKAARRDMAEREALYLRLARRRLLQKDGFNPSDVAPLFSFTSGEQMLRALADAPLREEAIRRETLRRLEADEPLANPKEFKRAVEEALHGKTAGRLAATILRAMLRGIKSTAELEAGAREAARAAIARTPIGKISVRGFAQAELRAAKARDKAIASGDVAAAIEAQRRLLVQHYLTLEAAKAEREIERETATIAKRFEQPDDKLKQGRNLDVVKVAIAMLGKWGMVSPARHNAAVEYLTQWSNLDPDGYQPYGVRMALLTENAVPMEQMSLDRFRVITEAASGLWSESKRSEQIRSRGKFVAKQQAQQELLDSIVQTFGREDGKLPDFRPEELHDWSVGAILANMSRLEAWTRKMDGGEPGAWHQYVYLPLKDALVANELEKVAQHAWAKDIMARHNAVKPLAGQELDFQPILGQGKSFVFKDRAALIGAIYQLGTEKGRTNFIVGNKIGPMTPGTTYDEAYAVGWEKWQRAMQYAVDKGWLFEEDFKLAQETWNHIGSTLKDRLFETTRDVWGFYPTEEKASSFQTPFGSLPGGYFPSKVDKTKSRVGTNQQLSAIQQGAQDFRDAHANVPRGVTIKRGEQVVQPRITDIRLLTQHIDETLNIINLQPALSDVAGLFKGNTRNNEHLGALREALDQVAPFAERKIILPALDRMARDSIVAPGDKGLAKTVAYLRQAASMAFLGFNPKNAALQFTGLVNAVPEVGFKNLMGAFWTHWHSPQQLVESIRAQSPAMRARWSSELQLLAQDMERMLEPSRLNDARKAAAQAAFFMQRMAQMFVDAMVWQAANDKATAEGLSTEVAGERADSAVRLTQGEKSPLDVPNFLSGNAIAQLFTQFADYPNTVLNQNLAAPEGKRFAVFAWTVIAPALATSAIGLTLAFGKVGKGERDDESYAKQLLEHFLGDQVRGAFGLLPIGGPLVGSALNELFGLSNTPGGMRNSPFAAWSIVETIYRIGSGQGSYADWITGLNIAAQLPGRPVANLVRFAQNVAAGRADYDGPQDYLRVLLVGK